MSAMRGRGGKDGRSATVSRPGRQANMKGKSQNGVPHGHGLLILGEARYEGEFSDGKPNGAGVLRSANGVFEGVWRHGCFRDGRQKTSIGVDLSSCP